MDEIIRTLTEKHSKVKINDADQQQEKAPDKKAVQPLPGVQRVVTRDWKHPAAIGYALIIFTFVVLGGWSAVAKLDSAVTAPGVVAEGSGRKSVQHFEGGIVKEILVREGEHVTAGQVLRKPAAVAPS